MSMPYDSVSVACPHCDERIAVRSRASSCNDVTFYPPSVPLLIAKDLHNKTVICPNCGVFIRMTIFVPKQPEHFRLKIETVPEYIEQARFAPFIESEDAAELKHCEYKLQVAKGLLEEAIRFLRIFKESNYSTTTNSNVDMFLLAVDCSQL